MPLLYGIYVHSATELMLVTIPVTRKVWYDFIEVGTVPPPTRYMCSRMLFMKQVVSLAVAVLLMFTGHAVADEGRDDTEDTYIPLWTDHEWQSPRPDTHTLYFWVEGDDDIYLITYREAEARYTITRECPEGSIRDTFELSWKAGEELGVQLVCNNTFETSESVGWIERNIGYVPPVSE